MKKSPKVKKYDVQYFRHRIYKDPTTAKSVLNALKDDFDIGTIKKVLRELESHPLVKKYFYGNPFPKKIKDLGNAFYTINSSIEKELQILGLVFGKFSEEINTFLALKVDYETKFLLGEYQLANKVLNDIEAKFGFSLWLIENRLLVEEYTGGLKGNMGYLSYANQQNDDPFFTTLVYFLSVRAEKKVSALAYKNKIFTLVSDLNARIKDYLLVKLNFLENENEISKLSNIISYDSTFSIIDRYLSFLQICQLIAVSEKWNNEKPTVRNILSDINKKIADQRVARILILLGEEGALPVTITDEKALAAFESYTIGDYEESLLKAKELILNIPTEISMYELYVKSLSYLRRSFVKVDDRQESFCSAILENLFHVYDKRNQCKPSILNLQKIIKQIEGFSISNQIYSILKGLQNADENLEIQRLNFINSIVHNPIHLNLCKAFKGYENLNVVKLFNQFDSVSSKEEIDNIKVGDLPNYRIRIYKAKKLIALGEFQDAVSFIEEILNGDIRDIPIHLYEECVVRLFECYYRLENIDDSIEIYVVNYLVNPNLISRIDFYDIPLKIKAAKFKIVNHTVNVPIFFKITNQDNHLINIAARLFLKDNMCERPQDIAKKATEVDQIALVYFLNNVCTPEVIKYFVYHNSTKDILIERAMIYLQLIKMDADRKDTYWMEINNITQNLAILEGIQEIDEGKIFVDEKNLIANELNETKANFARYIEISNLATEVPLLFIDLVNNKKILINVSLDSIPNSELEKSKLAENLKFELFKELFNEIRNAFLFSNKYGLESYLSTRIRHGTLLGQIRSQFQEQKLITKKNKENDRYYDNEFWANKLYYLESNLMTSLQFILADFSGKIDLIIRKITDDIIQIKVGGKNPFGLFDYTFPNQDLLLLFKLNFDQVNDYNDFLEGIFKELWKQTEICLEIIRAYFLSTVKESFNQCLDLLLSDIKVLLNESKEFREMSTSVISCKTNINNEIDTIANWFHLRQNSIDNFIIDKVINTSLEITNKISQGIRITPVEKDIRSSTSIAGIYFIHFFDLIRIFFENIVKHSELSSEELKVAISATEDNGILRIKITNNLDYSVNLTDLRVSLKNRERELNNINWDMERIKRETGGTGFYKAKKILLFDLQNERNTFTFGINESNEVEIAILVDLNSIKHEEDFIDRG